MKSAPKSRNKREGVYFDRLYWQNGRKRNRILMGFGTRKQEKSIYYPSFPDYF